MSIYRSLAWWEEKWFWLCLWERPTPYTPMPIITRLPKGRTQEQYQTASSRGHGGPRGSHVRSFWTQKNFLCPNDSILCPYLTSHVRMTPSRAWMSAKSCEIARKFIGIRAIRGVLHGVTGSSEAKSLYDEWLNRGHGVKNGRLDSLRGGLTFFLCQSLRLDEDIDAIDSDVTRLRMRL